MPRTQNAEQCQWRQEYNLIPAPTKNETTVQKWCKKSAEMAKSIHPMRISTKHSLRHKTTVRTTVTFRIRVGPRLPRPNYTTQFLQATRRCIRLHRRLMKLAPEIFDYPLAAKLARDREEVEQLQRQVEPILAKVYGTPFNTDTSTRNNEYDQHPLQRLPPWKRARLETLLTEKLLWLTIAEDARQKMEAQQPPRMLSLSAIASLLKVGVALGRIATGIETNLKTDPLEHLYRRDFEADLERIYGADFPADHEFGHNE